MRLPAATAVHSLMRPRESAVMHCLSQLESRPPDPLTAISRPAIVPASLPGADYIYAYSKIQAYFSSLSVEKEFFQAIEEDSSIALDDKNLYRIRNQSELKQLNEQLNQKDILYKTLSKPENYYIAREMCWILQIQEYINLYTLQSVNNYHLSQLISALKPEKNVDQQQRIAVLGQFIPSASNPECQALGLSTVKLTNLYRPNPEMFYTQARKDNSGLNKEQFNQLVTELLQLAQNEGRTDADRALNYLLLSHYTLYLLAYNLLYNNNCKDKNASGYRLNDIQSEDAYPDSSQHVVKLVFIFESMGSGSTEKWFCSIDTSAEYPFIVENLKRFVGVSG